MTVRFSQDRPVGAVRARVFKSHASLAWLRLGYALSHPAPSFDPAAATAAWLQIFPPVFVFVFFFYSHPCYLYLYLLTSPPKARSAAIRFDGCFLFHLEILFRTGPIQLFTLHFPSLSLSFSLTWFHSILGQ